MKFLCVACDEPMKLLGVDDSGGGSLSVLYGCPRCEQKVAMLTNPYETEMVQSLGVKIGPSAAAAVAAASAGSDHAGAAARAGAAHDAGAPVASAGDGAAGQTGAATASGCPFSGMVAEMQAAAAPDGPRWTAEALARLDNIPDFVRPMAKQGIEHYARTHGLAEIDEEILEQARGRFGM